ncbi:MAG: protein-L-isoaspartate O-methyltransferase [Neorhizobium sp.]|nr:protein-L-isoaspartate O-methyltransferase [Neorhizobium sp.]
MNFEALRITMVESQIRTTDVTSHSVLQAFLDVPREAFVPEASRSLAYRDTDIDVAPGRYLMAASPLAKLLQLASIKKTDKVLEIGAGTGYVTALLSRLASSVVAVESDAALVDRAHANLAALGAGNASVVAGELEAGHAAKAPYDVIFLDGSIEELPVALTKQLAEGGRLVAVVGYGNSARATVTVLEKGVLSEGLHFNASICPLPGFRKVKEFVF